MDPSLKNQVDAAIQDLTARLEAAGEQDFEIELVSADRVTWRTAALGCPKPGMMYMTALAPGVRIHLKAQGSRYAYHAGRNSKPFLCESGAEEPASGDLDS
ncbi:MAG: hypothetical protein AAFQ82_05305 [Myxococcota bacterium]